MEGKKQEIQLFEDKKVRSVWDSEQEKWYFSIVDIVAVLTESADPQAYWRKLKQRLKQEGNEIVTGCHGLKMMALSYFMSMGKNQRITIVYFMSTIMQR